MSQGSMDRPIPAPRRTLDAPEANSAEQETGLVVLLVDDDRTVRDIHRAVLMHSGMQVVAAQNGLEALTLLGRGELSFDVVVSDIVMPGLDGVGLLREVRHFDADIPVILVTGSPQLESAMAAANLGCYGYIGKPVLPDRLVASVKSAATLHRLARLKKEALEVFRSERRSSSARASLEFHFQEALDCLWVAFQPIVDWPNRRLFGYEALARTTSSVLTNPMALLDAAERLGRVHDVGQCVRALVARAVADVPPNTLLFVNLHASDLLDPELFDEGAPLSAIAQKVVLEITERASLDAVSDTSQKIAHLRDLGYRIAVDDLGAGYAGLSSFSKLEPEVVKLDMSLVRDVDKSKRQQSIVRSMISVCRRELDVLVICEGVETTAERDTLECLGATLLQGYLFGRPMPRFETQIAELMR